MSTIVITVILAMHMSITPTQAQSNTSNPSNNPLVSSVPELEKKAISLDKKAEFWTRFSLWFVGISALAAILYFVGQRFQGIRTKQAAEAHAEVEAQKDRDNASAIAAVRAEASTESKRIESDAKRQIAEANENAGKANERAGKIESANLTLRGQVANLETTAANARRDAEALHKVALDAKAAQQQVETHLAEQQARAAKAEKDLLELQERIKDRHLTGEQRTILSKFLSNAPKGHMEIRCPLGTPEARNFASELMEVFKNSGWEIVLNDRVIITPNPVGIKLWVHLEPPITTDASGIRGTVPERVNSIIKAFEYAHLPIEPQSNTEVPKNDVLMIVGYKP